jgi:cadmium resistance transport/sequestration family protein
MSWLISTIVAGATAFVATNIDDIVILMLFFAQENANFHRKHIITGQYLGFSALILASLPGFLGGLIVPKAWIGLLGLAPIAIGISHLIHPNHEQELQAVSTDPSSTKAPMSIATLLAPQTYHVAAVTIANGGDNIGIYVPLFANTNLIGLGVLLAVFFTLVAVWCYIAFQLTRHPRIAPILTRYGRRIVPFVLIALGIFILIESHSYQLLPWF